MIHSMFDRRRSHFFHRHRREIQTQIELVAFRSTVSQLFKFPALSDDGRPSFQIEFVLVRLN